MSVRMYLLLYVHVASAQGYSIRVTHNTNLRSTYRGQFVETVPSGTTLHISASTDGWINRNGNDVWMASWVSHTRV